MYARRLVARCVTFIQAFVIQSESQIVSMNVILRETTTTDIMQNVIIVTIRTDNCRVSQYAYDKGLPLHGINLRSPLSCKESWKLRVGRKSSNRGLRQTPNSLENVELPYFGPAIVCLVKVIRRYPRYPLMLEIAMAPCNRKTIRELALVDAQNSRESSSR